MPESLAPSDLSAAAQPADGETSVADASLTAAATRRADLLGMQIDAICTSDAVARVLRYARAGDGPCRLVVTPNVDHVVMHQRNPELRAAYAQADLVLADGMPLVLVSRILRHRLPCRVAGSDLLPAIFAAARGRPRLRVFLLGAAAGVADRAAANIHSRWPGVEVVGTCSPPRGFEKFPAQNRRILAAIAATRPDMLVVGLGAPKQELWVHQHRHRVVARVALCVGATIDFIAGEKARAPVWMRKTGLEWLHRCAGEPRRLLPRYLRDAWIFPQIVLRQSAIELVQLTSNSARKTLRATVANGD